MRISGRRTVQVKGRVIEYIKSQGRIVENEVKMMK